MHSSRLPESLRRAWLVGGIARAFRVYVEQPANSILATLSFIMAAAGLFVILVAREWLVGLSALFFFGLCAFILCDAYGDPLIFDSEKMHASDLTFLWPQLHVKQLSDGLAAASVPLCGTRQMAKSWSGQSDDAAVAAGAGGSGR